MNQNNTASLKYKEYCFQPDANFWKYNETRRMLEEKRSEIVSRYEMEKHTLIHEFYSLASPEIEKVNAEMRKISSLEMVLEKGMELFDDFVLRGLAVILQRVIFKYTKHDEMTVDEIGSALLDNPSTKYSDCYSDFFMTIEETLFRLNEMNEAIDEKYMAIRQRPVSSGVGVGVGLKGAVYGALSAEIANAGMSLVQGFTAGFERSRDKSKLDEVKASSVSRLKHDLVVMGQEVYDYVSSYCALILTKDMEQEIEALGIVEYVTYSRNDESKMKLRNNNYDEAYREGDIDKDRYASNLFRAINENPYDMEQYINLYQMANDNENDELKENIFRFSELLGMNDWNIVKQMDTFFKYISMERQNYACLSI